MLEKLTVAVDPERMSKDSKVTTYTERPVQAPALRCDVPGILEVMADLRLGGAVVEPARPDRRHGAQGKAHRGQRCRGA